MITVDLNPLSRTARTASITIVDNVARAMPLLVERAEALSARSPEELRQIHASYPHEEILAAAEARIRGGA